MKTKLVALVILIAGLLCGHVQAAEKVVDDRLVCAWILSSLNLPYGEKESADALEARLEHYIVQSQVLRGWERLKVTRDKNRTLDLELAAAEHYMYARAEASGSGDPGYLRLPEIYAEVKQWAFDHHLQYFLQQTDQPLSPPNRSVVQWGIKGAARGLKDYTFHTGKQPAKTTDSTREMTSSFFFYYVRYVPSPVATAVPTPVISN